MAKLTGDIIKAGLRVWVKGWDKELNDIPVELVIDTGDVYETGTINVLRVSSHASEGCISRHPDSGKYVLYLGDRGVCSHNYDNRATQVFTTREEFVAAMELWNGRNPNFVTEDGDSVKRAWEPDQAYYDYYEEE